MDEYLYVKKRWIEMRNFVDVVKQSKFKSYVHLNSMKILFFIINQYVYMMYLVVI